MRRPAYGCLITLFLGVSAPALAQVSLSADTVTGVGSGQTPTQSIDFIYRPMPGPRVIRLEATIPDSEFIQHKSTYSGTGIREFGLIENQRAVYAILRPNWKDSAFFGVVVAFEAQATGKTLPIITRAIREDRSVFTDTLGLVVQQAPIPALRYLTFFVIATVIFFGVAVVRRREVRTAESSRQRRR